jgi:glycerol-3-phosphate dehydrogenase
MEGLNPKTGEVILTKHYRLQNHASEGGLGGLISLVGVKYTTARDVAEKTVNMIFKHLGSNPPKHTSRETPLDGGEIEKFDDFLAGALKNSGNGPHKDVIRHLVYNYGSKYLRVLEYGYDSSDSTKLVPGSHEVVFAEVLHAVREEMAQKLSDVIFRRTDLGSGGHPGKAALDATAKTMAQDLGWTDARVRKEVKEVEAAYLPVG